MNVDMVLNVMNTRGNGKIQLNCNTVFDSILIKSDLNKVIYGAPRQDEKLRNRRQTWSLQLRGTGSGAKLRARIQDTVVKSKRE
eukprot:745906-Hanusia_phi.AAC.3